MNKFVCYDCCHEQATMSIPCEKCKSTRVGLISIVERHLGKDWKQAAAELGKKRRW